MKVLMSNEGQGPVVNYAFLFALFVGSEWEGERQIDKDLNGVAGRRIVVSVGMIP
jgi:hypothetical protein